MTVSVNGIAHIQLTISKPEKSLPFWEKLLHFLEMETLLKSDNSLYCIGSRTGILVREAPADKLDDHFDQDRPGLHHLCFRARSKADVDKIGQFVTTELNATVVHSAEDGSQFAPGYYSVLFEDPGGIRIEVNHVPGKGHFGRDGRLGGGVGPATHYGEDGLTSE